MIQEINDNLIIVHQNIRSLRKNFDLFLTEMAANNLSPQIIIFTEIWISSDETNIFNIPDYNAIFKCNNQYRSGGVAMFVKKSIGQFNFVEIQTQTADAILISFSYLGKQLHILALYRFLFHSIANFVDEFRDQLNNINNITLDTRNLFWIGDINIDISELKDSILVDYYKTLMSENGLECILNEPTRITEQSQTCIDHVFVRVANKNMLEVSATVIPADITDHCMIQVVCVVRGESRSGGDLLPPPFPSTRYRTDYVLLKQLFDNADWSPVYMQVDASAAFDEFFVILHNFILQSRVECVDKHDKNNCKKLKPWINNVTCMKIKRKNHLFKLTKKHPGNEVLMKYYKTYKNKLHNDIKNLKNNYYKQKFNDCKGDSKATWRLINKLTGQNRETGKHIKLEINNILYNDSCIIANEFNRFFLNVVNKLDLNSETPAHFSTLHYKNKFNSKWQVKSMFIGPVLPGELLKVINSLKNNTSPGIDDISSGLVKAIASQIVDILSYLINFSFQSGVFPSKLKEAVIIPLFKNGSMEQCNNYRPISLLSCFSKIYEKIMKQKLIDFLHSTDFFSSKQFGFRMGMSTENALLNFMTDVHNGLNRGKCVSGVFLDIKKAFDTVNHGILLDRLYNCGIRGTLHKWFKSYLIGRKQCVKILTEYSDMEEIKSGVPQGSVLGSILFIIYINTLCDGKLKGKITSFADDTAICYVEETWNEVKMAMTEDLEALQWWFTTNCMLLSPEKTKFINFNLRKEINIFNQINYKCADCLTKQTACITKKCAVVERTNVIKYLGMQVDSEVNWKAHITKLKSKMNGIIRQFYFLRGMTNQQVMRTLYFALVQSRIQYGIVLWGGSFNTFINLIYLQQKHIIRLIAFKNKCEHSRPLFNELNILPLKHLFVFKVLRLFFEISGDAPLNDNTFRMKLRNVNTSVVPKPYNSFFTRTYNFIAPRMFNKLPANIKEIKTKYVFIRELRKWISHLDDVEHLLAIQH